MNNYSKTSWTSIATHKAQGIRKKQVYMWWLVEPRLGKKRHVIKQTNKWTIHTFVTVRATCTSITFMATAVKDPDPLSNGRFQLTRPENIINLPNHHLGQYPQLSSFSSSTFDVRFSWLSTPSSFRMVLTIIPGTKRKLLWNFQRLVTLRIFWSKACISVSRITGTAHEARPHVPIKQPEMWGYPEFCSLEWVKMLITSTKATRFWLRRSKERRGNSKTLSNPWSARES